jgi:hypothetical protein
MSYRIRLAIAFMIALGTGPALSAETVASADWGPVAAADISLDDLLWRKRAVVVFADSPEDPAFARQIRLLQADPAPLIERDVIVIVDTEPAARSSVRQTLRPRGFSLVIVGKDGEAKLRKPAPWDVREISHAIDKFPLRRQEMLEQRPAGR